ncbi:DNA-directed RNA polymerase [Purpureocillium takamizusanense]|uniref:DNA-directed RNA polymerase n=1 Tax=Purpureocillium takamizusanense TaxID=2060973 RepID=A0A9Q8VC09_9HYPO|nr:DNA-directed RNA polymerase [Purpureocillium takamizusanense]UNI20223.1 DNA-directed RNA polymerase [Purpureocillium takamizusanense]
MKSFAILAASLLGLASAHMEMKNPPPLRSQFNKFTTSVDYDMKNPLSAGGSNYPCKGYHTLLNTPQGQTVADWTPGQSYSMTITGGAAHNGGSCQASLSFDGGKSFKVIHSYIGHCPVVGDSSFPFTVPSDTPAGKALFAWTWFNQVGNREMYMNCASVNIVGGAKRIRGSSEARADPIGNRPNAFVANVGNGCTTAEGRDTKFPNPGPDVTQTSDQTPVAPVGNCK